MSVTNTSQSADLRYIVILIYSIRLWLNYLARVLQQNTVDNRYRYEGIKTSRRVIVLLSLPRSITLGPTMDRHAHTRDNVNCGYIDNKQERQPGTQRQGQTG